MKDYECEGQIDIFNLDMSFTDIHYDRNEKPHKVPEWMNYERCENCARWNRYPVDEQPPCGWGIIGWCASHNQKVKESGYCNNWEDKFYGRKGCIINRK